MAQANATGLQPSDELRALLANLSAAQAKGIVRIVEAEVRGETIEALLTGPSKICARTTFYRRRGWWHNRKFRDALELARREARAGSMASAVDEAIEELKRTTPLAAQDLRRQIVGDEPAVDALLAIVADRKKSADERMVATRSLAMIGTPRATQALLELLNASKTEVRLVVIEALGLAAAGVNVQRRLADIAVLDRADKLTASKGKGADDDIDAAIERELARLAPGGKAADAGAPAGEKESRPSV